jgi:hypothetical protein
LYEQVFNDSISPNKLIIPLRILTLIENKKREIQKKIRRAETIDSKMLFIVDGAYHVLFAVSTLCEHNSVDPLNERKAKAYVPDAIKLVANLVQREMKADESFTFNRFFKDTKTKSRVEAAIGIKRKAPSRPSKTARR